MIRRYGETDFITGLRAIAAFMVMIVHTNAFASFGPLGQTVSQAGRYGVDIFFVISGFTIAATYAGAGSYRPFLIRRLWRIAPLYWCVIALSFVLLWAEGSAHAHLQNLVLHLSFLSYLDGRIANSLPGGEWTIPVEVFWYALLPFLLMRLNTWKGTLVALLICAVLTALAKAASKELFSTSLYAFWLPISHATGFLLGAYAFALRPKLSALSGRQRSGLVAGAWALFVLGLVQDSAQGELFALSIFLLLIALRTGICTNILSTRLLLFLGTISYSLYLIHLVVMKFWHVLGQQPFEGLLGLAGLAAITIALSTLTYLLIEAPTNRIGARIAHQRRGDAARG